MPLAGIEIRSKDDRDAAVLVRSGPKGIALFLLGLASVVLGLGLLIELRHADSLTRWVVARLALVGVSLYPIAAVYLRRQVNPVGLIPRRLAAGQCGACAYSIADLPRESDGCAVCPECGAAWRVGEEAST